MIIEKMIVKTGSSCSLKCEKCGEYNPYLKEKGKAYSVDMKQLAEDVIKIAKSVDEVSLVDVAGGEALTHVDLHIFIKRIAQVENIKKIHIVSNGTITPQSRILELLKEFNEKIMVIISDYSSAGVDNSRCIETLKNNGIKFHVIRDMVWLDKSDTSYKNYLDEELEIIADKCLTYKKATYFTLIDGKLSAHCPTAGSLMYYLDLYEECKDEYIDIRETDNIDIAQLEKLNARKVLKACNYCVPSYLANKCNAGEQLKEV